MYEIMICPIKKLYRYAEDGDMSDVAVLAVSSYDIRMDKLRAFCGTLCLNFADITQASAPFAFTKDTARKIAAYVKELPIHCLFAVTAENPEALQCLRRL